MMERPSVPQRCAGCLRPGAGGTCPTCGWDDSRYPETQTHLPRHHVLGGQYYLGRVLGQGGFGVTYFAWDLTLDRAVAIKEYLPGGQCTRLTDRTTVQPYDGDRREMYAYGLQRFLEEARTLARFAGHPCIVPVINFIEANGTAYMVMTYLNGITLKQHLANQGGRIPYAVAVQILMRIMDALRELHANGLLHRDVSPDNIFLTAESRVILIDFGAARHALGEHSQSLSVILKPGFAPEEQYRAKGRQGPWTDVYASAATLYRCITGIAPPPSIDRLVQDELERPSRYCSDLTPPNEAVLLRALAVRADQRIQTIGEFQRALQSSSGGEPAPPPRPEPPPVLPPSMANPPVYAAPSPVARTQPRVSAAGALWIAIAVSGGISLIGVITAFSARMFGGPLLWIGAILLGFGQDIVALFRLAEYPFGLRVILAGLFNTVVLWPVFWLFADSFRIGIVVRPKRVLQALGIGFGLAVVAGILAKSSATFSDVLVQSGGDFATLFYHLGMRSFQRPLEFAGDTLAYSLLAFFLLCRFRDSRK